MIGIATTSFRTNFTHVQGSVLRSPAKELMNCVNRAKFVLRLSST